MHEDTDSEEEEGGADTNVQDMEEDSDIDSETEVPAKSSLKTPVMAAPPVQPPAPAPPVPSIQAVTPANVTIKKYDPKAAAAIKKKVEEDQFLISPITG